MGFVKIGHLPEERGIITIRALDVFQCPACGDIRYVAYDLSGQPCPMCQYRNRVTFLPADAQPETTAESVTNDCVVCGQVLVGKRPHTKTCSPRCRKALSRGA